MEIKNNNSGLSSMLIVLRPTQSGQLNTFAGYQSYAAFLDLLQQVDPDLSQRLHDLNQRKPFTISSLLELNGDNMPMANLRPTITLTPSRLYALRLTSLNATIVNTFTMRFFTLDASTLRVRLGNNAFQVVRVEGSAANGNVWVGRSSFVELGQAVPARSWTFQFVSPTTFSMGEQDWGGRKFVVMPEPHLVFDSLAGAWNTFAPENLERVDVYALKAYVEKFMVVTSYNCQTAVLDFKQNRQLGFVGEVSYRVMEKNPSLEMATLLHQLAGLALYAGVGYKTTMGMGQVRCSRVETLAATPKVEARL